MTAPPQPPFVAQTPQQARLLLDLTYAPVLAVLIQAEAGAAEVAGHTRLGVKQAHHRLTRLLEAGLIGVTGERKRGGRPIRLYRAAAQVYWVPFALTDAATMAELIGGRMEPFVQAYTDAIAQQFTGEKNRDFLICLDERGHLGMNLSGGGAGTAPQSQGMYGSFVQLRLRRGAHEELERRLRELKEWAATQEASDDPEAVPCLLGLFFTPGRVERL